MIPETDFSVNTAPSSHPVTQQTYNPMVPYVQEDEVETPPVKKYRVTRGGCVLENGFRTTIKEGKEISEITYNLKKLREQGIRFIEINPDAPDSED
jgi:hypothetical protein